MLGTQYFNGFRGSVDITVLQIAHEISHNN
jgi:hypothetical protein